MDYRKLFNSKYFTAADIEGGERKLTVKVVRREVVANGGGEEECPIIHFSDFDKPLVLNKTNARAIAAKLGNDCDAWAGQSVTFRKSVTTYKGEEVPCVRVK